MYTANALVTETTGCKYSWVAHTCLPSLAIKMLSPLDKLGKNPRALSACSLVAGKHDHKL